MTLKTKKIKKSQSFILGISMSSVLLLRPNMIPLYIVYGITILIDLLRQKRYKETIEVILYFLLGTFIILGSCVIILLKEGILVDCFNEYIIFNFAYTKIPRESIVDTIKGFYEVSKPAIVTTLICIISIVYKSKKDKENIIIPISSLLYTLLTILIIILPRRIYLHYAMILIPTLIVPISLAFKFLSERKKYICLIFLISVLIFLNNSNIYTLRRAYKKSPIKEEIEWNKKIASIIQEKSNKDEKIMVIGNNCSIYLEADRVSASKYIYQFPIVNIDKKIREEVKYDLEYSNAKFIIYNKTKIDEEENLDLKEIIQRLLEKRYKKIDKVNKYVILERN